MSQYELHKIIGFSSFPLQLEFKGLNGSVTSGLFGLHRATIMARGLKNHE